MDNSVTMKLSNFRKAERLEEIKKKMGETAEISDEELVEAYETASNIKPVSVTLRMSSCSVTVGKISTIKADSSITLEEREFLEKSGNSTVLEMFPVQQKKLNSIMTKVHKRHRDLCIGGSSLMDFKTFEEDFLPFVKGVEEELEQVKESIGNDFYTRFSEFENETISITRKLFPSRENDVRDQLAFIKYRGKDGYLDRISICMSTRFGEKGTEISQEELRDFLSKCKAANIAQQAQDILCGFFDGIWQTVISYLVTITMPKYEGTESLEGFGKIRNKLKEKALKVKREAKPLEILGAEDIMSLASAMEKLSLNVDKYDVIDEGYSLLISTYAIARSHYGYELRMKSRTESRQEIPDWLDMASIVSSAEEIIRQDVA